METLQQYITRTKKGIPVIADEMGLTYYGVKHLIGNNKLTVYVKRENGLLRRMHQTKWMHGAQSGPTAKK